MRNLFILITVLYLGFCGCCTKPNIEQPSPNAPVNGLIMTTQAPETYVLGNEFNLQVIVKNVSDKKVVFGDWVPYDISLYTLEIKDNLTGESVKWHDGFRVYTFHFITAYNMEPNETYKTTIRLHEGEFTPPLKPGQEIAIKCTYEINDNLWSEKTPYLNHFKLTSNTITVKVFGEDKTNR